MHKKLSMGLTFGFISNVLFICFGFISYIFYKTYMEGTAYSKGMEIFAYIVEISGFATAVYSAVMLWITMRMRKTLKIMYTLYIVLEAVLMYMELNVDYHYGGYRPFSLALAIAHAIVSAIVCFSFLQLDPDRTALEVVIIICSGIILGGMMGNFLGIRIYFSIITNAVSFTILFYMVKRLLDREEIEIDCHGDRARVAEYNGKEVFFGLKSENKKK